MAFACIGFLISMTLGTTYAGYPDKEKQEDIFKRDESYLEGYDFTKPTLFRGTELADDKNNASRYTDSNFLVSPNSETLGQAYWFSSPKHSVEHVYDVSHEKLEHTKPHEAEVVKKTGVPEPQLVKIPMPQMINHTDSNFLVSQNSETLGHAYWFSTPKPSVEHVYDVSHEKLEHTKPHEAEVVKKTGVPEPQLVKIPMPQMINHTDSNFLVSQNSETLGHAYWFSTPKPSVEHVYDVKPDKVIEHTKPYEVEVVKKTGVPEPHLVKIPIPQVINLKIPHPYVVSESVPVAVALPIYKLVPEVVEKRIPIEVEKLVPVYKEKPYNVTIEKPYVEYVDKPYPVYVTIYKHVLMKNKPSHSGFVFKEYPHHYHH